MGQFTRRTLASRAWSVIAAAFGLALVSGGLAVPSSAHAAETIVVDDNFEYSGNGFVFLNSQGQRWAQPFTPKQDGVLASITIVTNSTSPHEFVSAQVHEMSSAGVIDPAPVVGGVGELTFAPHGTVPAAVNATASFPQRPELRVGTYYAVVIDPRVESATPSTWTSASFPIMFTGQDQSSYFVMQESAAGWGSANYTGQVYFSVRLALPEPDVIVSPDAPTLIASSQCNVPGTVTIPTQNGVEFTSTESGTDVTVTARALAGFVFPAGTQTTWEFSVAAQPCPVAPVAVTPAAPTVVPATCNAPGTLSVAETPGVSYDVTGTEQQTTVTASALAGYVLTTGAQTTWTFDLSALSCKDPVTPKPGAKKPAAALAKTGADSNALPLAALASMALGAGALLARRRSLRR